MGIDYSAKKGIGFQVEYLGKGEDAYDFFDELVEGTYYEMIDYGDSYDGVYYFAIILKEPAITSDTLERLATLRSFLEQQKSVRIIDNKSHVVGGLYVW